MNDSIDYQDWVQSKSGDVDWTKRLRYNQTIVSRMGVEIQVSGRSDLLARDIVHIRNNLQDSHIDAGVIVVPSEITAFPVVAKNLTPATTHSR